MSLIQTDKDALDRLTQIAEQLNMAKEFIHNIIDDPDELPDVKNCWELVHDARHEIIDVDHNLELVEAYYAGRTIEKD